jgi:hypothetical protein
MTDETIVLEPVETVKITFFKGIKPSESFYFFEDETQEIMVKLHDLYYRNEDEKVLRGKGMDKCVKL